MGAESLEHPSGLTDFLDCLGDIRYPRRLFLTRGLTNMLSGAPRDNYVIDNIRRIMVVVIKLEYTRSGRQPCNDDRCAFLCHPDTDDLDEPPIRLVQQMRGIRRYLVAVGCVLFGGTHSLPQWLYGRLQQVKREVATVLQRWVSWTRLEGARSFLSSAQSLTSIPVRG